MQYLFFFLIWFEFASSWLPFSSMFWWILRHLLLKQKRSLVKQWWGREGKTKMNARRRKAVCSWAVRWTRGLKAQNYRKSALYGSRCRGERSYPDVNWKWRYHTKQQLCVDNEKLRSQDKQWKTGQFGACTRAQEVVWEGKRQQHCLQYREHLLKFGAISDAACNAVASQLLLSGEKFLVEKKRVPSSL